jgi:hypothetical protein
MDTKMKILASPTFVFLAAAITTYAAEASSSSWEKRKQENQPVVSLYDQGIAANKNNDYHKALMLFQQALQQDNNNPDILNMMAHVQLKLGMIDESLENFPGRWNCGRDFRKPENIWARRISRRPCVRSRRSKNMAATPMKIWKI